MVVPALFAVHLCADNSVGSTPTSLSGTNKQQQILANRFLVLFFWLCSCCFVLGCCFLLVFFSLPFSLFSAQTRRAQCSKATESSKRKFSAVDRQTKQNRSSSSNNRHFQAVLIFENDHFASISYWSHEPRVVKFHRFKIFSAKLLYLS